MLAVAGKTKRVTVAAYPPGTGSRVVVGGDSTVDVARLRLCLKTRPDRPTEDTRYV
jgi:hypothetical protein